jgi:site-specific DNA recombinase
MSARAKAGEYPSKPPLGYINAPKTGIDGEAIRRGTRIVKLEWCDPLLLRMLDLRLGGASFKAIAATVTKENLVPSHKRRPFEQAAAAAKVEQLLKNPFCMGTFEWNHGTYPGTHEPVFSASQWAALQATFQGTPAPLRIVKRDAALAGFLRCAQCGCQITYDPKKRGERVYHYYRCANGKKQHQKLVYVSEADILDGFASAAEAIAIDTVIAEELARILNETHADVRAQRKRDSDRFRRELAGLEPQEDQLMDLLVGRSIDDAAYKRKLARIREQRADLAQKLEQASERLDDAHVETVRSTLELAKRAKLQWAERSAVEKRRFLELVLSNAQLDGGTVRYTLRKPFAILAEMRGSADWRTRHDSNMRPSDS